MSPITKKKLVKFFLLNGFLLAVALAYAAVYCLAKGPLLGIKVCFVRELFGVYCPGCGGSRALVALLQFHIWESVCDYPALFYTVLVIWGYDVCLLLDAVKATDAYTGKYPKWLWVLIPVIILLTVTVRDILLLRGIDTLGDFR